MLKETIEPLEINAEDLDDILKAIDISLGTNVDETAFYEARTFEDICTIFENSMKGLEKNDCTTQQAFYKIRHAFALELKVNKKDILPTTKLRNILKRKGSIAAVKNISEQLGFKLNLLSMKSRLFFANTLMVLTFIIFLFINFKVGAIGLAASTLAIWFMTKFSKEIDIKTFGELAIFETNYNYAKLRKQKNTYNKKEVLTLIQNVFMENYFFEREELTPKATFKIV